MTPPARCTVVFLGTGAPNDLSPNVQRLIREARSLVAWIEVPQALAEHAIETLPAPSRNGWEGRLRELAEDGFIYLAPGFDPNDDPGVEIIRGVLADLGVDCVVVGSSSPDPAGPAIVGPAFKVWRPDPALTTFVHGIRSVEELGAWRATIEQEFGPDVRLQVREWTSREWHGLGDSASAFPVTLSAEASQASRGRSAARLREVFEVLRGPDGCPWDRAQTHASLRRYILEEAAEVVDAIDGDDVGELAVELGDVLANIVLHAEIARQAGSFSWPDVIQGITAKMVRRHPHVFGDRAADGTADVSTIWREVKESEGNRPDRPTPESALPALLQAAKLAGSLSSDGTSAQLSDATRSELGRTHSDKLAGDETRIGDAILGMAIAAKQAGIDPELALRDALRRALSRIDRARAERSEEPSDGASYVNS